MGQIQGSMFEGLFQRAVTPTGVFRDELRTADFDLDKVQPEYPDEVWATCLKVAAKHLHPLLPYERAERELGRTFSRGFQKTLVGQVLTAVLPHLSREGTIDRVAKWVGVGSKQLSMEVTERAPKLRTLRMTTSGVTPHPYLMAGIVEDMLAGLPPPKVEVTGVRPDGYDLRVTW